MTGAGVLLIAAGFLFYAVAHGGRGAQPDGMLLTAQFDRIDGLVEGLPEPTQAELSQLLGLLATPLGRRSLAGLATGWDDASVTDLQQALQSMRTSSLQLRQQAYHALHDIVGGAYFSHPGTWARLGYPGPVPV